MGVHASHMRVAAIRALLNKERYEALDVRDPIAIAQAAERFNTLDIVLSNHAARRSAGPVQAPPFCVPGFQASRLQTQRSTPFAGSGQNLGQENGQRVARAPQSRAVAPH